MGRTVSFCGVTTPTHLQSRPPAHPPAPARPEPDCPEPARPPARARTRPLARPPAAATRRPRSIASPRHSHRGGQRPRLSRTTASRARAGASLHACTLGARRSWVIMTLGAHGSWRSALMGHGTWRSLVMALGAHGSWRSALKDHGARRGWSLAGVLPGGVLPPPRSTLRARRRARILLVKCDGSRAHVQCAVPWLDSACISPSPRRVKPASRTWALARWARRTRRDLQG